MHSKKIIIRTIIVYTLIMLLGVYITNSIISDKGNNVGKLISQLIASGYIIYIVKSIYGWDRVGFSKINLKSLIWFMPYILLLIPMMYRFMQSIYINIELFSKEVWIEIIIIFIGTSAAAFSEEVIFRGIVLNTIKSEKGIIKGMIISSLGFSIIHVAGIFTGISLIEVFTKVICSSLLGFSFVSLAIKLNNIWPLIIFHIVWNFIVMASSVIDIKVSNVTVLCNPLNIVISIILWTSIIMKISNKTNKKPYHN